MALVRATGWNSAAFAGFLLQVGRHAVAPGLVLLAPFVAFLRFQQSDFQRPEVLLCLAAIAAVSLVLGGIAAVGAGGRILVLAAVLVLFADVQFKLDFGVHGIGKAVLLTGSFIPLASLLWLLRRHAEQVISATAATVLVSTLLLPAKTSAGLAPRPAPSVRADLPLIVHIILDEHIGVDGLPSDTAARLQSDLRSFYHSLGFRTFDAAYSEWRRTELSLGHLLNFLPGEYHPETVRDDRPGSVYALTRNAYFSHLVDAGFSLHVYQSDFLQVCPDGVLAACETYDSYGLGALANAPLRVSEKARLIAGTYMARSKLIGKGLDGYDLLRLEIAKVGVQLPREMWFHWTAPINGLMEMRRVTNALAGATRGEMYFAHFLLPHAPFVYGNDCALRPLREWHPVDDSGDTQSKRMAAYGEQVRCASRMVREIVDAIPVGLRSDAVLIVQGDHGARLSLTDVGALDRDDPKTRDDRDVYSTLFAVRFPGIDAGSDHRFVPITCLLRTLVNGQFRSFPQLADCAPPHVVFSPDGKRRPVKRPLAPF
jgi:hypothetical protein